MRSLLKSNRIIFASLSVVCIILFINTSLFLTSRSHNIYDIPLSSSDTNVRYTKSYEGIDFYESKSLSSSRCLSFEDTMDDLVKSSKQIFITMPAKAAGSSMKSFTQKCMKNHTSLNEDNFFNHEGSVLDMMTRTYELPSIITGHIYKDSTMMRIIKGASDDTLVLYINRHETDRLVSAAQTVVDRLCEGKLTDLEEFKDSVHIRYDNNVDVARNNRGGSKGKYMDIYKLRTKGACTIQEDALSNILQQHKKETSKSTFNALSCSVFDAIDDNKPNMAIVNYKQANRLQKLLAKYHCPELLEEKAVHNNIGSRHVTKYVKLSSEGGREVLLDEWMEKKRDLIEWGFGLKKDITCQGKVRKIQRELSSCIDEMFLISEW